MKNAFLFLVLFFPLFLTAQSHSIKIGTAYGTTQYDNGVGFGPMVSYEYQFQNKWSASASMSYQDGSSVIYQRSRGTIGGEEYDNSFSLAIEEQSYYLDLIAKYQVTRQGLKLGIGPSFTYALVDYPAYIYSDRGVLVQVEIEQLQTLIPSFNLGIEQQFKITKAWSVQVGGILRGAMKKVKPYSTTMEDANGGWGKSTTSVGASLALNAALAYHF